MLSSKVSPLSVYVCSKYLIMTFLYESIKFIRVNIRITLEGYMSTSEILTGVFAKYLYNIIMLAKYYKNRLRIE